MWPRSVQLTQCAECTRKCKVPGLLAPAPHQCGLRLLILIRFADVEMDARPSVPPFVMWFREMSAIFPVNHTRAQSACCLLEDFRSASHCVVGDGPDGLPDDAVAAGDSEGFDHVR